MSTRWGLVGFGEAGRVIGAALAASGADLAVHDRVLLDPERGPGLAEAVRAAGAQPVADVAGLADRDVVLSLVTPATALAAAEGLAAVVGDGVLYVDLNSTAPQVKEAVAATLPAARVVDGVMTGGGIRLDGSRIPISLAGPDAGEAARLLCGAGFTAAVVGERVGAAAAPTCSPTTAVRNPAPASSRHASGASGPASEIGMRLPSSRMPPPVITPSTTRAAGSAAATASLTGGAVELRST